MTFSNNGGEADNVYENEHVLKFSCNKNYYYWNFININNTIYYIRNIDKDCGIKYAYEKGGSSFDENEHIAKCVDGHTGDKILVEYNTKNKL